MTEQLSKRELKKRHIAIASIPLFAKGFDATNIEQIAKAANIGKGTVYEYFDSKNEIFTTAIESWIEQANAEISLALKGIENPVDAIKKFVEIVTTMFNPTNPEIIGLFSTVQQQVLSESGVYFNNRAEISRLCSGALTIISDILLEGITKGVFKPEIAKDVSVIARNMLAYLDGIGLWSALLPKNEFDYNRHVQQFFNIYIEMIRL